MIKLVFLLVASLSVAITANLVSLQAFNTSQGFGGSGLEFAQVATHGDTMVTWGNFLDETNTSVSGLLVFREKNGQVVNVANVAFKANLNPIFFNGKWMGGYDSKQAAVYLYQLDADAKVTNQTQFEITDGALYPTLLSDNSIVYYDSTRNFSTLALQENGTWTLLPKRLAAPSVFISSPSYRHVHIDDNSLVFYNYTDILIHTRQSDGSWLLTDIFAFNSPTFDALESFDIHYNGIDSVVLSCPNSYPNENTTVPGFVVLYTKINNEWQYQVITASNVGLTDSGSKFGQGGVRAINKKTLVLSAALDGVQTVGKRAVMRPPSIRTLGKVFVIQRQGNTWEATAKISSTQGGLFGMGIGVTNKHLIALRGTPNGYSVDVVPVCVFYPVNATCFDIDVSTCQLQVSYTDAYEITQCGNYEVKTLVTNERMNNNSLSVTFEFDRILSPTVTCSSVLSCPVPPSTVIVAPSSKSVSSASIVSSFVSLVFSVVTGFALCLAALF